MRLNSTLSAKTVFASIILLIVTMVACKQSPAPQKIPFDEKNALTHIRPYDTLTSYIETFRQRRSRAVQNGIFIDTSALPLAESFNRDAIIALLNATDAKNIRIYLGQKPGGQIAFCILPVDSAGNDIAVQLVDTDRRTALKVPGISSAQAAPPPHPKAQGVEEGQRCPTMCSAK